MDLVPREKLVKMLKRKRQRIGVKQKKAASVADLSPSHVNRIENNTTNPSYDSIYQLWKALDQLEKHEATHAKDLMNTPVDSVSPTDTLETASRKMRENGFSQLPVKEDGDYTGRITETAVIEAGDPDLEVKDAMGPRLMETQESTPTDVIREMLKNEPAVLISGENGDPKGIITKTDLL